MSLLFVVVNLNWEFVCINEDNRSICLESSRIKNATKCNQSIWLDEKLRLMCIDRLTVREIRLWFWLLQRAILNWQTLSPSKKRHLMHIVLRFLYRSVLFFFLNDFPLSSTRETKLKVLRAFKWPLSVIFRFRMYYILSIYKWNQKVVFKFKLILFQKAWTCFFSS